MPRSTYDENGDPERDGLDGMDYDDDWPVKWDWNISVNLIIEKATIFSSFVNEIIYFNYYVILNHKTWNVISWVYAIIFFVIIYVHNRKI